MAFLLRFRQRQVYKYNAKVSECQWLEVLLAGALELHGVEDGLALVRVARAQRLDLGLHLGVQPRHARLQLAGRQEAQLQRQLPLLIGERNAKPIISNRISSTQTNSTKRRVTVDGRVIQYVEEHTGWK